MLGLNFSPNRTLRRMALLLLVGLAGCGGANACCTVPPNVNKVGGVIPPGTGTPTVPGITIGNGGSGGIPIVGTGPFTAAGCPGIVNAT